MIQLDGIGKVFGTCIALDGVTLTMHRERIYGLWGRNGAGKTTLMRIIAGTLPPDHGVVRVLGKDPTKKWSVRRRIGIVEDGDAYFPELTADEFLWWVGRLRNLADDECEEQIQTLTRVLYLEERADSLIGSLSHGMRRKVAIAGAFMGKPELVMLDEPTSGLDVDSLRALCGMLEEHRRNGGTAVLACHVSAFIKSVCSDVAVLQDGTVDGYGPLESVDIG